MGYRDGGAISIAQIARDLGVNEGTLGNWVLKAREAREGTEGLSRGDIEELKRLRAENAELRMERDVLKRSVVLWVLSRCRDNTHYAEHRIMPSTTVCGLQGKGIGLRSSA